MSDPRHWRDRTAWQRSHRPPPTTCPPRPHRRLHPRCRQGRPTQGQRRRDPSRALRGHRRAVHGDARCRPSAAGLIQRPRPLVRPARAAAQQAGVQHLIHLPEVHEGAQERRPGVQLEQQVRQAVLRQRLLDRPRSRAGGFGLHSAPSLSMARPAVLASWSGCRSWATRAVQVRSDRPPGGLPSVRRASCRAGSRSPG